MRLNADFSERVVVRPDDYRWVDSPAPGVERMMLDRIGEEVARATSLVRYAPLSSFPAHVHGGGEEFLVLEGEFGDEHRNYPQGTYVRNPIGTEHAPRIGAQGCTIFVKLCQFEEDDTESVVVDTRMVKPDFECAPGVEMTILHRFGEETVYLVRWTPGTPFNARVYPGGAEMLVLEGSFSDEHGHYPAGTWVRYPDGSRHEPFTKNEGAASYVKTGHLPPAR
ncbi:MAG: cupin domain-containing protein [Woeseiaceae bacterium]|nr:cupin domain-containing protein [Woeseiaceae bacterium]